MRWPWRLKSEGGGVPALSPEAIAAQSTAAVYEAEARTMRALADVAGSMPALAQANATSVTAKGFDWMHYSAMTEGGIGGMFSGEFMQVPTIRIMKAMVAQEPWVNYCTTAISKQFFTSKYILKRKASTDGQTQIVDQHPFLDYLRYAGQDVEPMVHFMAGIVSDLVVAGNGYWYTSPDMRIKRRLPADRVDPIIERNRITQYRLLDRTDNGFIPNSGMVLTPEEVTHVKVPNPFSVHIGMSFFIATVLPVLIEKYGREFIVGFFLRGGQTSGIIETDTTDANKLISLARTIMQAFGGRKNMHADKILPKGASWKNQNNTFADMRLIDMLKDNVGQFRAATGCTNTVLGIVENVNRATAYAEMELFWKATILPIQELLCAGIAASDAWKRFGMMDGKWELSFDNRDVEYLDDFERRADSDAKLAPTWTVNERRVRLGKKEIARFGDKLQAELTPQPQPGLLGAGAPAAGTPAAPAAAAGAAEAASNAVTAPTVSLNGAQVSSMLEIIDRVATRKIPRATGVSMLETAFALSPEQADSIMGEVGDTYFAPEEGAPTEPAPAAGKSFDPATATMVWKAAEEERADPTAAVMKVFSDEFDAWLPIIIDNLEDKAAAERAIEARGPAFAERYSKAAIVPAMGAYDAQLELQQPEKSAGCFSTKESQADRETKLAALRKRAKQVIEEGILSSGARSFVGYSDTAMDSIYDFIAAELEAGKSLADVAAAVRMKFSESYGLDEAYPGQAMTIVQTEYGSALSIAQAQFADDLVTVTKRMSKGWLTLGDSYVRDSHVACEDEGPIEGASEQVVDTAFSNGLRYPREGGAPADEVINCRCTVQYRALEWKD